MKTPHPVDIEVGKRIMVRRKILGMSQNTLAQGLGVSFQQVQKYEKGTNRVGSSRLSQIAQALCVPVTYFFSEPVSAGDAGIVREGVEKEPMMAFLETEEARALNIAFARIRSTRIRRQIVKLIDALSEPNGDA